MVSIPQKITKGTPLKLNNRKVGDMGNNERRIKLDHFWDILEERFLDLSGYVRSKVVQMSGSLLK